MWLIKPTEIKKISNNWLVIQKALPNSNEMYLFWCGFPRNVQKTIQLHNNRQLNIEKKNPRFKWRSFTRNIHLRWNKRVSVGRQRTFDCEKEVSCAWNTQYIHWALLKSTNQIKFLEHNYCVCILLCAFRKYFAEDRATLG